MKILIIGGGGREHALASTYAKSKRVKNVFVAPGNDFMEETSSKIRCLPNIGIMSFDAITEIARKENIDIVDVAQDESLAAGLVDILDVQGIPAFGPTQKAAEIEWSKAWSREFMQRHHLPIPRYTIFSTEKDAIEYCYKIKPPVYIKASGLAAGKGALRAETSAEMIKAIKTMRSFGKAGKTFIIEEAMIGEEFSLFAICDGDSHQIISTAQDHKTVYNADSGPNTGGMGCVAPSGALNKRMLRHIQRTILSPFIEGMRKEDRPYIGILYLGGIITEKGVKIVEFNARWGDPEAEVILPGLTNDYVELIEAVVMDELEKMTVKHDGKIRISVAGCARGYPSDYSAVIGKKIFGLQKASRLPGISIYGAGIKRKGKDYTVNGGRIFHIVAEGKTIAEARARAYAAMSHIFVEGNNLHYRTDIGWREVERSL
jgi:phosphoribosylamine--glycine ligase